MANTASEAMDFPLKALTLNNSGTLPSLRLCMLDCIGAHYLDDAFGWLRGEGQKFIPPHGATTQGISAAAAIPAKHGVLGGLVWKLHGGRVTMSPYVHGMDMPSATRLLCPCECADKRERQK